MAIEHLQRVVIANDTQAAVEAAAGALAEIVFGRDTATGAIGYSVDAGVTWTWLPTAGGAVALDDLSDVVISGAAINHVLRFNGSNWENAAVSMSSAEPLTNGDATTPEILFGDDGDVLMEG